LFEGPPGAPGTPVPGKVTSTSIEIKWTEPENDGGSAVSGYVIEYKEVGGDWCVVSLPESGACEEASAKSHLVMQASLL